MPSLEITELILVLLFPLSIIAFIYAATKRKDVIYYIPGFISLFITFLSTNMEAIVFPDLFNLLEHSFILVTGILLFLGALFDTFFNHIRKKTKQKTNIVPRKTIGGS
ncbi:MAG: hypothetical protein ACTSSH_10510 [Candidatus Heimdallarchaeota archaeon]